VFKVPAAGPPGLWRTVFPTDPAADEAQLTAFDTARARMERFIGTDTPFQVVHTNLYSVNQRVASSFRKGRILLAGDAAHLNNPLGGMGMNFGIHDAENLARSLNDWRETGREDVLDRYDRQRRFAAEAFLQSITIENKESLEKTDADAVAAERAKFRRIAADPVATRAFLLRSSMIEGFNKANAVP
jgi:3-(3-hydroxy-phenyl)propionate hydroxylase